MTVSSTFCQPSFMIVKFISIFCNFVRSYGHLLRHVVAMYNMRCKCAILIVTSCRTEFLVFVAAILVSSRELVTDPCGHPLRFASGSNSSLCYQTGQIGASTLLTNLFPGLVSPN